MCKILQALRSHPYEKFNFTFSNLFSVFSLDNFAVFQKGIFDEGMMNWKKSSNNVCMRCGKIYTGSSGLYRHYKYECGKNPRFQCPYCQYRAKRRSNMYPHIRNIHAGLEVYVIDLEPES